MTRNRSGGDAQQRCRYPASVQPSAIELFSKLPDDEPVARFGEKPMAEAIATIGTWLKGSASQEKAAELVALAKRNSLAPRSLTAYAKAAEHYRRGRPR